MKDKGKRIFLTLVSLVTLSALLLAAGLSLRFETAAKERYFEGTAQEYYEELISSGFPADYASALTELHLLHPNWEFVPLHITQTNSKYTWNYVITQETKNPKTNLVHKSNTYALYRHPTNTELYDSGYYQASTEAVAYFMDPRNFLNETDIFQFYDLKTDTTANTGEINAVLAGTFMESGILENGMSYADYFAHLSVELGINPVYLAAKVRQEQGSAGTSPTISGKCGSLLADYYVNQTQTTEGGKQVLPPATGHTAESLQALDGYYNAFNVKASGTGVFSIYYNAMNRAVTGTPDMASAWDGSPGWNTMWKSLWGGSAMLKSNYIDRYQSTVYLQKFNVDGRAADRNFWGQYMQNVSGALTESRSLYSAFASVDALDSSCVFLIPVYEGMPADASADPADGTCTLLAQATARYSYTIKQSFPDGLKAEGYPLYQRIEAESGDNIHIKLEATHDYGVIGMEYSLDGGPWIPTSEKELDMRFGSHFDPDSRHILVVRGIADYDNNVSSKKCNSAFLCAVYYINVLPPKHEVTFVTLAGEEKKMCMGGDSITLPPCALSDFVGWIGSDGSFLPAGTDVTVHSDLTYTARTLSFYKLEGAALSLTKNPPSIRFSAVLEADAYQELSEKGLIRICARHRSEGTTADAAVSGVTHSSQWVKIDADTPALTDFDRLYTADFYVELLYTDQTVKTVFATGEDCFRSVHLLAAAALAHTDYPYTREETDFLRSLLPQ